MATSDRASPTKIRSAVLTSVYGEPGHHRIDQTLSRALSMEMKLSILVEPRWQRNGAQVWNQVSPYTEYFSMSESTDFLSLAGIRTRF